MKQGVWSPKKWWPDYLLVDSVEMEWQGGKWGSTVYTPPSVYCPFQKCPQWLKLWMYSQQSKCFWKRFNALWPFWCTLAVTILCWLQLCTVTRSSVVMLSGHCCTDTNITQHFHSGILFVSDAVVILLPWLRWWTYVLALHVYTGWTTAGDNILGLCGQKTSYQHGSYFQWIWSYGRF